MKWIFVKIIFFLGTFIFFQGAIVPWVISNDQLPLWADILILCAILICSLTLVDYLISDLIKRFLPDDNEATAIEE